MSIFDEIMSEGQTPTESSQETTAEMQQAAEFFVRRRAYIREKYVDSLVNPVPLIRRKAQQQAMAELKMPDERQYLIDEVSKMAKIMEWDRRRRATTDNYATRFRKNITDVAGATAEGMFRMVQAFGKVAQNALGGTEMDEDVRFRTALEAAKTADNPDFVRDDSAYTHKIAAGIGSTLPQLGGGIAAVSAAGPAGGMAYWAAQEYPDQRDRLISEGHSGLEASLIGGATATAIGATEMLIPNPLESTGIGGKLIKGVVRKGGNILSPLAKKGFVQAATNATGRALVKAGLPKISGGMLKRAGREAAEAVGRTVGETIEENIQAQIEEVGVAAAAALDEKIEYGSAWQIPQAGAAAQKQALPGLIGLGVLGAAGGAQNIAWRYRKFGEGKKQARINNRIMDTAVEGRSPTRSEFAKMGLDDVLKERNLPNNSSNRKAIVDEVAGELQTLERARAVRTNWTPSQEEWTRWGMEDQADGTPQGRLNYLRQSMLSAAAEEHADSQGRQADAATGPEQLDLSTEEGARALQSAVEAADEAGPTLQTPDASATAAAAAEAQETPNETPNPEPATDPAAKVADALPEGEPGRHQLGAAIARQEQEEEAARAAGQTPVVPDFIKDAAGHVGVRVHAVKRGLKKARRFLQNLLITGGDLKGPIWDEKLSRDHLLTRYNRSLGFLVRDFDAAVKEEFGTAQLTEQQRQDIDDLLRGKIPAAASTLSPKLKAAVGELRTMIDALSQRLIDIGAVSGKLAAIISANKGVYLTRSFKAFESKFWPDVVPDDVRIKAEELLRQEFPNETDPEIRGRIKNILYQGKAAENPLFAHMEGGQFKGKNEGILRQRLALKQEIRDLLGENVDPRLNAIRTVQRLADLVANHQFLANVRDAGLVGGWFSETRTESPKGDLIAQITSDYNSRLAPLNGLYTTPEIADAFNKLQKGTDFGPWLRAYYKVNSFVKLNKTVFSHITHIRNLLGNTFLLVQQGHWDARKFKQVMGHLRTEAGIFEQSGAGKQKWRDYSLRLAELGITSESVFSEELRAALKDASKQDMQEYLFGQPGKTGAKKALGYAKKLLIDLPMKLYALEDEVWKVYAFENEKARYRKAKPGWTEREVEEHAAKIVRNTFPTYSMVPEGIRGLRRFPLVGTFTSFPFEIARTTVHTFRLIGEEMEDPHLRRIGAQRLAGTITNHVGFWAMLKMFGYLVGMGNDKEAWLRQFMFDYNKNSQLVHSGEIRPGVYRYTEATYTHPNSMFPDAITAFMRGDSFDDKIVAGLVEFLSPYIEEEILFKAAREAITGKTEFGEVWDREDTRVQRMEKILEHIWNQIEPGEFTTMKRIKKGAEGFVSPGGRSFSLSTELWAAFLGIRYQELDIPQSLAAKSGTYSRRWVTANTKLTSVLYRRGTVTYDEVRAAHRDSEEARQRVFNEQRKLVEAAMGLGLEPDQVYSIMKEAGMTEDIAKGLMYNQYIPREFSKETLKNIQEATKRLPPEQAALRIKALLDAVDEQQKVAAQ